MSSWLPTELCWNSRCTAQYATHIDVATRRQAPIRPSPQNREVAASGTAKWRANTADTTTVTAREELGTALHHLRLRSSGRGGLRSTAAAHTEDATSNTKHSDFSLLLTHFESAPAHSERPTTVREALLNDGLTSTGRSRRGARDGRHEEHTSLPRAERRQSSAVRPRVISAPVRGNGRRPQCGEAECGSPSGTVYRRLMKCMSLGG